MSPETIAKLERLIALYKAGEPRSKIAKTLGLKPFYPSMAITLLRRLGEDISCRPPGRRTQEKITVKVPRETFEEFQSFLAWKAKQTVRPVSISSNGRHA
jgi:hypothetical protein